MKLYNNNNNNNNNKVGKSQLFGIGFVDLLRPLRYHWIKDMKYSTKVKDEEGFPSFALINKATGEALKHSIGATHPVRLVPYKPDYLDESVLWTESRDTGDGFRCIRMVNNIRLNFDALHGDKDHGGVRDGTFVVLWEWLKGDNQRWKIVPHLTQFGSPKFEEEDGESFNGSIPSAMN
ncbi:Stress responsive protein [Musa troglodytarum]|uniref:Stress responsive protein n=1 Tax=Musa troglodytarum TaxID=320322 RepID=A0A9E7FTW8_9LILI|nr:Stress responsive protein [Musa troglodytarum]